MTARQERFRDAVPPGVDACVLFRDPYVSYLSGFIFAPTERPLVLVLAAGGESVLLVPRLEEDHARGAAMVDRVVVYDEYPGREHPMTALARLLDDLGLGAASRCLGIDADGYPPVWGYRGPPLSETVHAELMPVAHVVDDVMMVKSDYEVGLIRSSSRWAARAHELLQEGTRTGLTETEVAQAASMAATAELVASHPDYFAGAQTTGARAGYRGQIGRRGAKPHSFGANVEFQPGDTLVTGATAPMWGYLSELERTMFIGEPSARQKELFGHMLALQDLCLEAIGPGRPASDVDAAMGAYFDAHRLWDHWRHHVGHGIGRRFHENPFLDRGDDTVLESGMVLTVEPGLYDDAWGGFRHSDTVLVTSSGSELLTHYPRALEALVLPAA